MLNLDKSPILNLSKKGLAKASLVATVALVTVSISTGVMPLTVAGVSNTQPANAFIYDDINSVLKDVPRAYRWLNEGRLRQTYFQSFDGDYLKRTYGASADPVLHRWCSNTFSDWYLQRNPFYWNFWTGGRYIMVASRFEGNRGNCYYRGL
jgi:hypothetical protein